MTSAPGRDGGSRFWRLFFRAGYRFLRLVDPLLRRGWRAGVPGLDRTVDLVIPGRRSGRERRTLLTRLTVEGTWYVGHPNGASAWTRNLDAAGRGVVHDRDGAHAVAAFRLHAGAERERVIGSTAWQQPFPANIAYALAGGHVRAVGAYYRLERRDPQTPTADPESPT